MARGYRLKIIFWYLICDPQGASHLEEGLCIKCLAQVSAHWIDGRTDGWMDDG